MERLVDLHTHTTHSDGALSPEELIKKASEIGLAAIAIADHENTDGLKEALVAGKKYGVEIVPAVEISSYPDPLTEHHVLGYYIDYNDKTLQSTLKKLREAREKRARKVIDNLNELGYQINFGDVKAAASGTIVQPHIAWAVIADTENHKKLKEDFGDIPDTGEFIRKYLIPGAPAYESRKTLQPKEAVDLIHKTNGVAVFAHPCWTTVKKEDDRLIFDDEKFNLMVKAGIDGVEVLAHRGGEEDTKKSVEHFLALTKKNNLFVTGGSDYHGFGSAGKELGFANFYLKVPYSILEGLKKKSG
ncbi:MAG: PHP domain-containing protein [Candidatus Woykebacteria bacterium]